jgi:hypothetical protein
VNQAGPVIVVVEQGDGAHAAFSVFLQSRFRVVTCPVESVALEFVTESRPAAVLQDASAFYLDPAVAERWRAASPSTRVFFVDTDGPWALLMEPAEPGSGHVTINPCALDEIASAVHELLGSDGAAGKEYQDGRMAFQAV